MLRIAFAGSFAARMAEPVRARLSLPYQLLVAADESDILPRLADVDVLVSMGFSARMAQAAPRLRLLQVPGAGLDRIDRAALRPGTRLANAYGHEAGIAEYIIGAMIALSRGFSRLDAKLRQGQWESQWATGEAPPPLWRELAGSCLGIVGYGHIGRALARRAAAFAIEVRAVRGTATLEAMDGVALVGGPDRLDDLLRQADHLAITLPLSAATRNLIDARRLRLMKPTAYLINVARAEIVDQTALYQALARGQIAGAALDVWYRYPSSGAAMLPAALPFHELSNVLMTPHISGWTQGMLAARAELIARNIERAARGEPPLNAIGAVG
jgi:phosphoglycerate dehydrogenase-like enzyme